MSCPSRKRDYHQPSTNRWMKITKLDTTNVSGYERIRQVQQTQYGWEWYDIFVNYESSYIRESLVVISSTVSLADVQL